MVTASLYRQANVSSIRSVTIRLNDVLIAKARQRQFNAW